MFLATSVMVTTQFTPAEVLLSLLAAAVALVASIRFSAVWS